MEIWVVWSFYLIYVWLFPLNPKWFFQLNANTTISIHDLKLSEDQLKIFFDSIFDQAWLYLEEMPVTESPKKLAPAIYGERGVKLTYYKVRKLRLEKLMNGFYLKSNNLLNLKTLNIECFFPEADNDPSSPHMQSVCDSILQYFQNLDPTKPLLDPNSETYIRKLKTLKIVYCGQKEEYQEIGSLFF